MARTRATLALPLSPDQHALGPPARPTQFLPPSCPPHAQNHSWASHVGLGHKQCSSSWARNLGPTLLLASAQEHQRWAKVQVSALTPASANAAYRIAPQIILDYKSVDDEDVPFNGKR